MDISDERRVRDGLDVGKGIIRTQIYWFRLRFKIGRKHSINLKNTKQNISQRPYGGWIKVHLQKPEELHGQPNSQRAENITTRKQTKVDSNHLRHFFYVAGKN